MSIVATSRSGQRAAQNRALLAARLRTAAGETNVGPLSFAQQRLWFLDQLEPNSALYNIPALLRLRGKLDIAALQSTLDTIVARHEALRTRFVCQGDNPVQVVDEEAAASIRIVDLTLEENSDPLAAAQALIREECCRPFDLKTDSLLRVTLIGLGAEDHFLLLNMHHIVSDEWSMKVLFREISQLYESGVSGKSKPLPPLPIQYSDYASWQREWLEGEVLAEQLNYWKEQLKGSPAVFELPSDRPRGSTPTFRGLITSRIMPVEIVEALKRLANEEQATLFMVLLAAFKTLLHRYTQEEDIVVGSPIAGRNRIETEGLIGFFVNTLALRTKLDPQLTFVELLRRVRETTLGAFAHQDVPFERLVEETRPERTLSHSPFSRIMFALQGEVFERMQWGDLKVELLEAETGTAKFELTLMLQDSKEGLAVRAEYNADLFDQVTIDRLLAHFENLLKGIAADPECSLSELPLLEPAERRQLLEQWNQTQTDYPSSKCIHTLFEAQAAATPEAVAVVFGNQSLTYCELNERANQLAHYLRRYQVGPDVPVAICVHRSIEMVVGFLGILKAGGAYVPLDTTYPRERLAFTLEDIHTPIVLTQQRLLMQVPRNGSKVLCLDGDWELIGPESRQNLSSQTTPDNLAYIMYTSGSTGVPKGVAVPHRAVNRLVRNTDYIRFDASERIAQISNVSFDAATFEIWGALLNGGQLIGISKDIALSPNDFARELKDKQITSMFVTTALFNQLAAEVPDGFSSLKNVLTGGEVADPKWMRHVLKQGPQRLVHVYGPTENTTFSTSQELTEVPEDASNVPIGKPIANSEAYILDGRLQPVPIGVPGELYLGGEGLARGYWNRPVLTKEKFIAHPFSRTPGARLYKTGDLARFLPDGRIEFLGRIDNQVKIRGFRVELGEIETVLAQHPAVSECVVKVWGNASGPKRLVAYFVPSCNPAPNASVLRAFLQQRLPDYMIPAAFVQLAALPLNANGKVDRKALPEPDKGRPELEKKYAPPRDEVEKALTDIWEKILGIQPIGIEDKFFDLGGHSLLAVRVIARIEQRFGRKLRLATIFQAPTIEQLAAIIREEIHENHVTVGTSLVAIQSKGTRRPLFLVHGAGGGMFWGYANLVRHLGPDQPVYGFKSRGLDGRDEFSRLEEMAAHYVADLRAIQPHGPYNLGGYCFGGNVAFEMARQLEAQGERVALLALMNCAPPNSRYARVRWTPAWGLRFLRNALRWAKYVTHWSPSQRREYFRWKGDLLRKQLVGLCSRGSANVNPANVVDLSSYSPEQRRLWEVHIKALHGYHPKSYGGHVHLFRSPVHPLLCSFDADYGWSDFVKDRVKISVVPGAHEKILEEPYVEQLAAELASALNGVHETQAAPKPAAGQLAVFRGVAVRATLFWLGAHGEMLLADEPGLHAGGWTLGMLFHQLGALSGTRRNKEESQNGRREKGEPLGELPPEFLPENNPASVSPPAENPDKRPERRSESLEFTGPTCERMKALAEKEHVSLPLALLALSKAFLHRNSQSSDLSVGTTLVQGTQVHGEVRCAVNELVVRTDHCGNRSFRQLLQLMRSAETDSGSNSESSNNGLEVTRTPLFEVCFNDTSNGSSDPNSSKTFSNEFALSFVFTVAGKSLLAEIEYNTRFFDGAAIGRMLGHLKTLMDGIIARPDDPISTLPLLQPSERRQMLVDWNRTGAEFPLQTNYAREFEAQVARTPNAVAVRFEDLELPYAELNARANQLAHYLQRMGVGPEVLVAVCLDRSMEMVATLLAVLKAGGAYVPLDPNYPRERLSYMLEDSQAPILITHSQFKSLVGETKAKTIALDEAETGNLITSGSTDNPACPAEAHHLAYVIYTSGSTGNPKGVQITHRSLLNHNWAIARAYGLEPHDRVLQFNPISFDISIEEIFPSLLVGSTLVLRTDDVISSPAQFLRFVAREKLTVLNLPTAYWHEVVECLGTEQIADSVRLMIIGGEKASDQAYRQWKKAIQGKVTLINSYGPTETTISATMHQAQPEDDTLPIGRPIANVYAVILDNNLQPVPVGSTGELYIGGAGVARGYLRRPELTAERFINNPLSSEVPCDRFYRTGDLARFRPDGSIEFLGRADDQVKIRGFRIELGEIEAALRTHPGVKEAVVTVREDTPGKKRLAAYFVARTSTEPRVSELLVFLKRKLPNYMVPSVFVPLDSLPLTPAGKVDRRGLPTPGNARPELDEEYVAPRTPLEEALESIWSEVLGLKRIGVHDNFFDLGGHSLLATQVISRLRDTLQMETPLAKLFALPTVAELAAHLAEVSAQSQPVLPASLVSKGKQLPLTIAQRRIWFLDQFEPEQSAYNIATGLRLSGKLNLKALERSLTELARRHEALRAMFPTEAGQPVQHICEPREIVLPVVDLQETPESEREAKADAILSAEAARPYVMSSPMLRVILVRLNETEHALLLTLHEIAADTWSMRLVIEELTALYAGFANENPIELPALPISYSEAISRPVLTPADEARHLEYWKQKLATAPPLLELPADRPRPVHQSDSGARQSLAFPPKLATALKNFAQMEGCTPFTTLLGVFEILLFRYTGSADIVVGTLAPNRQRTDLQNVVGRFTNFIPLRSDLAGEPTFREVLKRIEQTTSEATTHGSVPFGKIVDEVKPERNASYTPVFQVMFLLEEDPLSSARIADLDFVPFVIDNQTAKFDLTLHLVAADDGISGWIEYSTALFDRDRIERLAEHFLTLAEAALNYPEQKIAALRLLPPHESQQLAEWNQTERAYPRDKTLIEIFDEQVSCTPQADALVCGTKRLTFEELQRRSWQVARRLKQLGVGKQTQVGICLERSWEMVAGILGTLRAGAAYVPMDPVYPKERLGFMLEDSGATVLLTQQKLSGLLPDLKAQTLCVEDIAWENPSQPGDDSGPSLKPDDLAYVIYTSGSTGKPKGVAIEHRNAVAFVSWAREVFTDEELSGVLAATSICFDLSIFELFVPLSFGGKVILADNPLSLPSLPAAKEVKLINTVPSAIRELLRIKGIPDSVSVVNLAGEPLATPLVDQIYGETAVQKVYDLYGPTETTTYSTFTLRAPGKPATIGKPLANEQVYILDHNRQLAPIGVAGELYIGGDGVAREYLHRPELTAEKFVQHPFKAGARLYRTGDLARWRVDGHLEYLGRIDHQVKIRGFRIELGEIEAVLKKQPSVREVVVMAREDQPGDKRLAAYVVTHPNVPTSAEELRNAVKVHLPEYMAPSAFVFLDALPLTPNGKVDRKALPPPEVDRASAGVEYISPRTPTEEQLVAIWREVLHAKEIGVRDDFFELGGHSLLAIQVISRVRELFKVELPLFSLFDAPTIEALADGLERGTWTQNQLPVLPLQPIERKGPLPVSFVQERLWFIDQLEPNSHAYNVPMALRLKGPLNVDALRSALSEIIRRHETLRTTFDYIDGTLAQVIAPTQEWEMGREDLRQTPSQEKEAQLQVSLNREAQKPFDLARGPLLRATLVSLDETDHAFLVVMHHTISDGWSLGIFFHELETLYNGLVKEQTMPQLPALPVTYVDFAGWQRRWMQGTVLDRELSYWKEKLAQAPSAIALPADRSSSDLKADTGSVAGRRVLELPEQLVSEITKLSQREGGTHFMVLMTTLAITLHKWTRQADLVIGTVVAGRNRRELENVIGCFMNFLPIRTRLAENNTGQEILAQVRSTVLEGQGHQECPFERIVEAINPQRQLNRNPLYNVALLYQNFPTDLFRAEGLTAATLPVSMQAALLDLRLEAEQTPNGHLTIACEYKSSSFSEAAIDRFLASFRQILETLLRAPATLVRDLPITELEAPTLPKATDVAQPRDQASIAITSTFTAEPIEESLRFWAKELGLSLEVQFSGYNQVFQELLDPNSLLAKNSNGLNVVLLRLQDWQRKDGSQNGQPALNAASIQRNIQEFVSALRATAGHSSTPFLVCLCPPSPQLARDSQNKSWLDQAENNLVAELNTLSGVYVVSSAELAELYPVSDYDDPSGDDLGHVPYTPVFFAALGTMVARRFHALRRPLYKVIALDCDHTLWSGVCGEDGPKGLCLDQPRQALQQFMRDQHDAGMLLCLCSKNNQADVDEVFAHRVDMPLRPEHFAARRLNWDAKSSNLRSLARELNLGLDSFIFIDDNPVECAEVQANCPEVLTLQLPEDVNQIQSFLRHCWAFDHLKLTAEDRRRTETYRQNKQRTEFLAEAPSLTDFIRGLNLNIAIKPLSNADLSRASQLTQRTNQFNFTTRRRSEAELQALSEQSEIVTVSVTDRFGDYGMVGLMIFSPRNNELEVDTCLLSCRVLGRGVEHRMLAHLGEIALQRKVDWVIVHFEPSAKNQPAWDFLERIGASFRQSLNGGYVFRFPADSAANLKFDPQGSEPQQAAAPGESLDRPGLNADAGAKPKFKDCCRIAATFNNAEAILKAIDSVSPTATNQGLYTPPQTDLEKQLCALWERLLHVDRVGLRDNFFELGGHSLLAVRLFAELEKLTGRKLPLVTLFQSPTVEELAKVLNEKTATASQSLLVAVQPHGSKPPLVLIHGAGGDVLWGYANLAAHMPPDQPIYGMKSRGQVGLDELPTLEEMAAYYLKELRKFQPHGPYMLGGYCFGGNVAYEMARQLRAEGEHVSLLALLDTAPSNAGYETMKWWHPSFAFRFVKNLRYWVEDFMELPSQQRRSFFARKGRAYCRKWLRRFRPELEDSAVDLEDVIDLSHFPDHELKLWQVHLRALVEHIERPYQGDIILFRTRGQALFCSLEPDFCWSKLVRGRVIVKEIPGSHENIFIEPNVQSLACQLAVCLSEAQAAANSTRFSESEPVKATNGSSAPRTIRPSEIVS